MREDKMLRRSVGIIVAAILSCSSVQEAHPLEGVSKRSEIGFVSQVHGSWVDRTSGLHLQMGDRIYKDSRLDRDGALSREDAITVSFHGVNQPVSFECKDGMQCRAPIEPQTAWEQRQAPAPRRAYGLILRSIAGLLKKDAPNWVITMSPPQRRGGLDWSAGVVRVEGETLEVADLLESYGSRAQLPPPLNQKDILHAELCPVTDEGLVQCPESPVALYPLPWTDSAPRSVTAPGVSSGLYLLIVCYPSRTGQTLRSQVRALVLVTPAERFTLVAEEWQHMREAVSADAAGDRHRAHELWVAGLVSLRRAWML